MKTAVITGISKGIGKALAHKFLAGGYRVVGTSITGVVDFSHENLAVVKLDLRDPASIRACAKHIQTLSEHIDILINNAGVLLDEDETKVLADKLRDTLEVNLIGTIDFTEQVISQIDSGGHIVNVSSTAGSLELVDDPVSHFPLHYPAYKISKAALNMYMRTLALRLKDVGIIVSSVHPGWVRTDMGGPEAEVSPEEAAEGIYNVATSHPETGQFWFRNERLPW